MGGAVVCERPQKNECPTFNHHRYIKLAAATLASMLPVARQQAPGLGSGVLLGLGCT